MKKRNLDHHLCSYDCPSEGGRIRQSSSHIKNTDTDHKIKLFLSFSDSPVSKDKMLAVHFSANHRYVHRLHTILSFLKKNNKKTKPRHSHSNYLFMSVKRVVEGMLVEFQATKPPFQRTCEAPRVSNWRAEQERERSRRVSMNEWMIISWLHIPAPFSLFFF